MNWFASEEHDMKQRNSGYAAAFLYFAEPTHRDHE